MATAAAQDPPVRAGGYCRISSDPKDKREGVDRQREDVATLCEVKKWQVSGWYIDNDRSATSGKPRPEWERLLADIEAGKIDAVAAWDQDRVNRTMDDLQRYQRVFIHHGVKFATTNGGEVDLTSPQGVLMAQTRTAYAQFENSMMRVRMRRAARQKAERGRPKWRKAFGYLPYTGTKEEDTGHREPDPVTGPLVAEAYRAILAGASLLDVCKPWNEAGHYGLTGKPWTSTTLSLFLRKARNAGLRSHTDTKTGVTEIVGPGTWTPLVDEKLWRSVQHVLKAPGRAPGPKSVRRHLLTGLMRCGKCAAEGVDARMSGQMVIRKTGGAPGRPKAGEVKEPHPGQMAYQVSYACKRCRGCAIRAGQVEPIIDGMVVGILSREDAQDLLKVPAGDPVEAQRLLDEKAVLHGRLNEIADERADGLLTGAQAKRATERIQANLDVIEKLEIDADRLRVLEGIPLGTDEVGDAVADLSDDRYRAVVGLLMEVTILPVGKTGGRVFNPERVKVTPL